MQASTTANVGVPGSSPGLAIHERPANVGVPARRIVGRRISPDARTGPFRAFSAPSDRQMRVPRRTSDPACVSGGPSWAPFGAWARPGGGPIPRHQHAGQGVPPSGGESAHQRAALELRGAEVLVKLVADALIRLGLGLAPGALLLADLASASSGAGRTPTPWSGDPAASAPALTIAPRFRSDRATLSLTEIVGAPGSHHSLDDGRGLPPPALSARWLLGWVMSRVRNDP